MTVSTDTLISSLSWRYAAKRFDAAKKIPESTWSALEESLRLSPSSFGLQPWRFIVVTNQSLLAALREHAWNQPQITECSHLVVLCAKENVDAAYIDNFADQIVKERAIPSEAIQGYRDMMKGALLGGNAEHLPWAQKQCYIALGTVLTSAALLEVDACPMEGFVPAKFDEILGLSGTGYRSTVLCALGYRSAEDPIKDAKKVRFAKDVLFTHRS